MVAFVVRLLACVLVLGGVLFYDAYLYVQNHLTAEVVHKGVQATDENGKPLTDPDGNPVYEPGSEVGTEEVKRTLLDGFKELWAKRNEARGVRFCIGGKLQEVEDNFIYEDNGQSVVFLDAEGKVTENQTGNRVNGESATHLTLILGDSKIVQWKLHYLALLVLILLFFKDIYTWYMDKTANQRAKKNKEKMARKIVESAHSLWKSAKFDKVVELVQDPKNRAQCAKEDLEKLELPLGRSYIGLNQADKGIPLLKRYAKTFEDQVVIKEIGQHYAKNRNQARTNDISFLCAYADANPNDAELNRFVGDFAIKNKITDRNTVRTLMRICMSKNPSKEHLNYVLTVLSELGIQDESAFEFYEHCKLVDPENPKPVLLLAEGHLSSGRFEDALDCLESLLNLDYENQRVHDMLFIIYQLKERLNDLYSIYSSILEQVDQEPIALTQQRKIQADPSFKKDQVGRQSLSLQELLAMRKEGDASVDTDIMRKYEKVMTIMFTDIKGYTKLTESQSPLETMQILQEGDEIIPPIVKKHEGVVIKKIGDAFMARFDSADSALVAGMQIQQAMWANNKRREADGKVRWEIRMGMNTGPVILKEGDVFGDTVNVASRVESSGEANQVYCTESTKDAVQNSSLKFDKKEAKNVKGKSEAIQLYALIFDLDGKPAKS